MPNAHIVRDVLDKSYTEAFSVSLYRFSYTTHYNNKIVKLQAF